MATLTGDITKGTLTGSGTQDIVATAGGGSAQETYSIVFRNYSGSNRTVTLYINGTTSTDVFDSETVDASGGRLVLTISVGPSDIVRAEASAGSSIAWFCSKGILT